MNPRKFFLVLSAALLVGFSPVSALRAQNDQNDSGASVPASKSVRPPHSVHHRPQNDDQVVVAGSNLVEADKTVGDAVAVLGSLTVDGHCAGDAVAVMGNCVINGTVDGDVSCIMGDLTLGPKAHVAGDLVCVMGKVRRDPGAFVGGSLANPIAFDPHAHLAGLHNWWIAGLSHGQLLPVGPHVAWLWILNFLLIGVYVLAAALFPNAMRRTGDMLVEYPGHVLLAGFLAMLALPVLFVLLFVTVVGIPVAVVLLPIMIFLLVYFGKASLYGLFGRKILGEKSAIPLAVLVGGLICLAILAAPFICILFYLVMSYLGFGCALTALLKLRKPAPAVAPPASPAPSASSPVYPSPIVAPSPARVASTDPVVQGSMGAEGASAASGPSAFSSLPPPQSAPPLPFATPLDVTLPRANFWRRTGAMVIDIVLVAIALSFFSHTVGAVPFGVMRHHDSDSGEFLIVLAAYAAVMWKLKGTTVGGLICHLHVVRLDGRPVDWPTAVVRALGCFVSLCAIGLGFLWVAFDPERQSWHDKLAGTTVVISVTRRSLV